MPTRELVWIAAGDGYGVALDGERILARSPKGSVLKSMPAALKDAAPLQRLRELRDWLARHARESASTVEAWMVRSLPVPVSALCAVWPDPAWQTPLRDAVLVPLGAGGQPQRELRRQSPTVVLYAGGQLLVIWQRNNATLCGYWSARPGLVFDLKRLPIDVRQDGLQASWELADGSRTAGGRALHPGDTSLADETHLLTDGTTFWQLIADAPARSESPRNHLREYDPTTGRAGATSVPAFLREFDPDANQSLRLDRCWLLPCPPGVEATPLGSTAGLLGWRVRTTGAGCSPKVEGYGIDGRSFKGNLAAHGFAGSRNWRDQLVAAGLVSLPGDESRPRPLSLVSQSVSLWSVDGAYELFQAQVGASAPPLAKGTPVVLSPLYWHNLRARDPAGSRALRALSDSVARQLLESATRELGDRAPYPEQLPATDQLIRELLPAVSDVHLLRGIGGAVHEAGRLARQRAESLQPPVEPARGAPAALTDQDLREALQGFLGRGLGRFAPRGAQRLAAGGRGFYPPRPATLAARGPR